MAGIRIGDRVRVTLSLGNLVSQYGQYNNIPYRVRDTELEGTVVYLAGSGRVGVQFTEEVQENLSIGDVSGKGIATLFGRGKLFHSLYFKPDRIKILTPKPVYPNSLDELKIKWSADIHDSTIPLNERVVIGKKLDLLTSGYYQYDSKYPQIPGSIFPLEEIQQQLNTLNLLLLLCI